MKIVKIFIYVILLALMLVSMTANAQSKPKRDISKDRSTLLKQKEHNIALSKKKVKSQKRITRRKVKAKRVALVNKEASYLWINHKNAVACRINANGKGMRFDVNTDGKNWWFFYVPSWCKITKYSDSFVLECEPNPNHFERKDWFKVMADNQNVKVDVIQEGAPIDITASFSDVYLQHNKLYAAMNCLQINASVNISGAKGLKCRVVALFYDEKYRSIKAGNYYPSYTLFPNNVVYAATEIEPVTDVPITYNVSLYLPNDAMAIEKKGKVRCSLQIYCVNTNEYVNGANYNLIFKAKRKKGKIKTYKVK